jgi:hypothetical protein
MTVALPVTSFEVDLGVRSSEWTTDKRSEI